MGEDTFTKTAPVGSFAQPYVADASLLAPIYTGDHGMGWSVYPDGWPSTYTAATVEGYQPSTVLSVHDGMLDFDLHQDSNGNPVGANLSPWPGGSQYQTYGAWSFCEKVTPTSHTLDDFYQAPLLWPQLDDNAESAESDFPEGRLNTGVIGANAHFGGQGYLDQFSMPLDLTQWHVFTQEWGPGYRSYYVDGNYVGFTSTNQVWPQPERWQLQIEPATLIDGVADGGTGHVYIAWAWIGKPA